MKNTMTNHAGQGAPSFTLPNGITIQALLCEDSSNGNTGDGWISIDIIAEYPDGRKTTLACADFDRDIGKLRVFAFEENAEDYTFEAVYNFKEENV